MKSFEVELQLVVFKGINLTLLCFKKIYMSLFWRLKLATAAKFSKSQMKNIVLQYSFLTRFQSEDRFR